MADYITLPEAQDVCDDTSSIVQRKLTTASRAVDKFCGRYFSQDASATARIFTPRDAYACLVNDISTTAGLVVKTDVGDDGTYETTWAASDYQLEPLNGIVDGLTGWPYTTIRAVANETFPTGARIASVQITAQWGWAAVPEPVKEATAIHTLWLYKQKDAPFGIAGFGEYGAIRVREHPVVAALLNDYVHPSRVALVA